MNTYSFNTRLGSDPYFSCGVGQEFFDVWPVLMGEQPPYSGPVTPDGRVGDLSTLMFHIWPC